MANQLVTSIYLIKTSIISVSILGESCRYKHSCQNTKCVNRKVIDCIKNLCTCVYLTKTSKYFKIIFY